LSFSTDFSGGSQDRIAQDADLVQGVPIPPFDARQPVYEHVVQQ
jgi:hypothetical protein